MVLHNNKMYTTFTRKLIYVIKVIDNSNNFKDYDGSLKIGDTTIENGELNYRPNSDDLRKAADKRIKEYMTTSGLHYELMWAELAITNNHGSFRDFAVHNVLKRSGFKQNTKLSGNEWYIVDLYNVKKAISAVKENRLSIKYNNSSKNKSNIKLRPEQREAINKTREAFKNSNKMLWNAKMRFGKTLTSLELIKKEMFKKVLIITHRPIVDESWFNDFQKISMSEYGYSYGSKRNGDSLENLYKDKNNFIYFASIQDLVGSRIFGGKIADKNILLSKIDWDLIIVDEAHEGTQTEKTKRIMSVLEKNSPKILELSGTPFNILDQYNDNQVFTWNYIDEQEAKTSWNNKHSGENPYYNLPKVNMFTFDMRSHFKNVNFIEYNKQYFNFNEFFRVDNKDDFIYKDNVNRFLDNITSADSNTNYPFSTRSFRNSLRHTLWILPGIKEANALENLLNEHPVFGKEYKIVNVVKSGDNEIAYQDDLDKVNNAITDKPYETKTITLTVRKLTTGVTIKPWTGVVFLSNTTSTMQYLQAAFRAQTPYSDISGMKTDCYIFDFAPDRALTIMAGTASLATDPGRLSTKQQEYKMNKLLNFLPIIGEVNNGMKQFDVDKLLTKLKRAYAEKAVRTGFDDDSIYSDELLKVKSDDLQLFNKLQNIVGSSKSKIKANKFQINDTGLNDDEYEKAINGKKKKNDERTPEEKLAIKKMREEKKQRAKKISILRSVSIRIPLMIYGLDLSFDEDINMDTFVNNIDDSSWNEFMPKGVDKSLFNKFQKYYDAQVFIEAGRIIREQVIELDNKDPLERTRKLSEIFKHFKNPDKETVLTPWRVINMQLNRTIGGISFYDNEYKYTFSDGNDITHWINTDLTDDVFKIDTTFLEINSKTGLYPLYVAISLYWNQFQKLNENEAGKFSFRDEIILWEKILNDNIYVIAKTPMARDIAIRTLCGYKKFKVNIFYIDNLVKILHGNINDGLKILERNVNKKMKFNVIIGNPPYNSEEVDGKSKPIYQYFVDFSKKLNPDLITLITPSKWFTGGKSLGEFRNSMLNDVHIKSINHWIYPQDVFPNTNIRGGVSYFLWDKDYDNTSNGIKFVSYDGVNIESNGNRPLKLKDINVFIRSNIGFEIVDKKIYNHIKNDNMSNYVSKRNPFGISTTFKNFSSESIGLKCFFAKKKIKYIDYDNINKNIDIIDKWKVLIPKGNNIGTELSDDNLNVIIAKPGEVCSETYLVLGADLELDEVKSNNLLKYTQTKFFKYLLYLRKIGQNTTYINFSFIPIQDFSDSSIIQWDKPIDIIDAQLFNIYNFSEEEVFHINENIKY